MIDPHAGSGVGVAGQGGVTLGMAWLLGGTAPRLSSNVGRFAEASLNACSDGANAVFTVRARGGIHLFF